MLNRKRKKQLCKKRSYENASPICEIRCINEGKIQKSLSGLALIIEDVGRLSRKGIIPPEPHNLFGGRIFTLLDVSNFLVILPFPEICH